jgi:hypothetical protein
LFLRSVQRQLWTRAIFSRKARKRRVFRSAAPFFYTEFSTSRRRIWTKTSSVSITRLTRRFFPRAACVVHQGGVGTTAQVLRAGVPHLIMPYSHDQPDNAARCERIRVARTISREKYSAKLRRKGMTRDSRK